MDIFRSEGTVNQFVSPIGTGLVISEKKITKARQFKEFDSWLTSSTANSQYSSPVSPTLAHMVHRTRTLTGWSNRKMASALSTSHPTIASILQGRMPAKVDGLAIALEKLSKTVGKIWLLCKEDAVLMKRILSTVGSDNKSVESLLVEGRYTEAYLASLDSINERKVRPQYASPLSRRIPGNETVSLVDDDGQ